MSSGPDRGRAVGTMGRHMTALSPWCGATARAAAQQDKKTPSNQKCFWEKFVLSHFKNLSKYAYYYIVGFF